MTETKRATVSRAAGTGVRISTGIGCIALRGRPAAELWPVLLASGDTAFSSAARRTNGRSVSSCIRSILVWMAER